MNIVEITSSITRPNDTAQYTIGDVWANSTSAPTLATLTNCVSGGGGSGRIVEAVLVDSANVTPAGDFEVWIFNDTVTQFNDNAPLALSDAECLKVVTVLPFSTGYVGNTGSNAAGNRVYVTSAQDKEFRCKTGVRDLYFMIVARNAYVPVANETLTLLIHIEQT